MTAVADRSGEREEELSRPPDREPSLGAGSAGASGVRPLYFGFFLLGLTLGVTTGLSTVSGISQTLLTSLFTFVSGILLTYAGFQRKGGEGESAGLDPARVGHGMTALMLGILLGLYGGIYARLDPPVPKYLKEKLLAPGVAGAAASAPTHIPTASEKGSSTGLRFELNAEAVEICRRVWGSLLDYRGSTNGECSAVTGDLEALFWAACPAPAGSPRSFQRP